MSAVTVRQKSHELLFKTLQQATQAAPFHTCAPKRPRELSGQAGCPTHQPTSPPRRAPGQAHRVLAWRVLLEGGGQGDGRHHGPRVPLIGILGRVDRLRSEMRGARLEPLRGGVFFLHNEQQKKKGKRRRSHYDTRPSGQAGAKQLNRSPNGPAGVRPNVPPSNTSYLYKLRLRGGAVTDQ